MIGWLRRPEPPSPCVEVCALDDARLCAGCRRTPAEIAGWSRMTRPEKRRVLAEIALR